MARCEASVTVIRYQYVSRQRQNHLLAAVASVPCRIGLWITCEPGKPAPWLPVRRAPCRHPPSAMLRLYAAYVHYYLLRRGRVSQKKHTHTHKSIATKVEIGVSTAMGHAHRPPQVRFGDMSLAAACSCCPRAPTPVHVRIQVRGVGMWCMPFEHRASPVSL